MNSLFDNLNQSTVGAAQVQPVGEAPPDSGNIFDSCVLLNLELKSFGTSRKLKDTDYEVDASKDKTRASKKLLKSEALRLIGKFDGETRRLINVYTLPSQFKSGLYLLPIGILSKVDDMLQERIQQRQTLVSDAVSQLDNLKWQDSRPKDEGGLGSLYNDNDYPSSEDFRAAYDMSYSYTEFSAPGKLQTISRAMYEREAEKAQATWKNAIEEGQELLRAAFADIIEHMHERLSPSSDGKPKTFKNTLVSRAIEFLSTFDARNLANDEQLAALVSECRQCLNGISPDDLRKNETIKARVKAKVSEIKANLDSMVVDKPSRRINLTESDDWGAL